MTRPLPKLLLVDPAARDRLRVMAALTGLADVHTPEPTDDPVRLVRHTRFDLVLVALPRLAARRGLSLCRTLKTDGGRPPPVGLLDPWRRLRDIPGALEDSLADGYLGGAVDPSVLARMDVVQRWLATRPGVTSVRSVLDALRETHRALKRGDPAAAVLPSTRPLAAQLHLLLEGDADFAAVVQEDASRARMTVRFNLSELESLIAAIPAIEARLTEASSADLTFTATGYGMLFARLEGYLVDSQVRGMLIAFVVITVMLGLLLRSLPLALFAMIPNLGPVIVGLAIMAAAGIPLDPGTLMVGPLALGLVVDDTVHFLVRYRRLRAAGRSAEEATAEAITGTGRALVLTTVLLAASFLVLLGAGTAMAMHFGVIAALVAVLALVADLVVLPAALRVTGAA